MSQQNNHFLASLGMFLFYVFLGLPVMAIGYVGICLYACVYLSWEKLRDFFTELWRQCSDPGYYRISWIDGMARGGALKKAYDAKQNGDWESAIHEWRWCASLFSNQAMFELGECYEKGWGVEEDAKKAVEWYLKAANQGDGPACTALGNFYRSGIGVTASADKAFEWYKKGAAVNDDQALLNVGNCYYYGMGTEKDYTEAVKWYGKSAEQGNIKAQTNFGVCHEYGQGTEQNYAGCLRH